MKFKKEEIRQIRSNMLNRESWIKIKTKRKDLTCPECKRHYADMLDEKIGMMIVAGKSNQHICNDCIKGYVKKFGLEDLNVKFEKMRNTKSDLIDIIMKVYKNEYRKDRYKEELQKKEIEELEIIKNKAIEEKNHQDYIDNIDTSDWILDSYLEKQYNVIIDKRYLKDVSQLDDYFKDYICDDFECGQGYYMNKQDYIVFINYKYYSVHVEAEIGSAKQDRGDRLYWVEGLENLTYKEIQKPKEKQKEVFNYNFRVEILPEEKEKLDKFLSQYINKGE